MASREPVSRMESYKVILTILGDAQMTLPEIAVKFDRSESYTRILLGEMEAQGDLARSRRRRPVYWWVTRHA